MRCSPCLLVLLLLVGCDDRDVERRRQFSLERMDATGGSQETQRVRQLIMTALRQADDVSLEEPRLVNVTMRVVPDESRRGSLGVDWIAAEPIADGVRIRFSDGAEHDLVFDDVELSYNRQQAKDIVVFVGNPFVEHEHPDLWAKLLADPDASVVLLFEQKPVSNERPIHRTILQE